MKDDERWKNHDKIYWIKSKNLVMMITWMMLQKKT